MTRPVDPHIDLVERACKLLLNYADEPVTLGSLAGELEVSSYHLQRTFKRVMGLSPRQYVEARRLANFKSQVKKGSAVTVAIYDAGYGSSSRLYEKAGSQLGMTPAAYARGGKDMKINFTIADSPLGKLLVAATQRGICAVTLGDSEIELENNLRAEYHEAEIAFGGEDLANPVNLIVNSLGGEGASMNLPLDLRATAFQWRVWNELQKIPRGQTRTYSDIARAVGNPSAARAVARACASNQVALVIPCHRVIREDESLGGYRWGLERKKWLLELEKNAEADQELFRSMTTLS
jgi:AraC family transcriptional regulator of adaptative response/methylated-DNA-[protein]-cysteine methyltransferase